MSRVILPVIWFFFQFDFDSLSFIKDPESEVLVGSVLPCIQFLNSDSLISLSMIRFYCVPGIKGIIIMHTNDMVQAF